jgi:hypothetical protein
MNKQLKEIHSLFKQLLYLPPVININELLPHEITKQTNVYFIPTVIKKQLIIQNPHRNNLNPFQFLSMPNAPIKGDKNLFVIQILNYALNEFMNKISKNSKNPPTKTTNKEIENIFNTILFIRFNNKEVNKHITQFYEKFKHLMNKIKRLINDNTNINLIQHVIDPLNWPDYNTNNMTINVSKENQIIL